MEKCHDLNREFCLKDTGQISYFRRISFLFFTIICNELYIFSGLTAVYICFSAEQSNTKIHSKQEL